MKWPSSDIQETDRSSPDFTAERGAWTLDKDVDTGSIHQGRQAADVESLSRSNMPMQCMLTHGYHHLPSRSLTHSIPAYQSCLLCTADAVGDRLHAHFAWRRLELESPTRAADAGVRLAFILILHLFSLRLLRTSGWIYRDSILVATWCLHSPAKTQRQNTCRHAERRTRPKQDALSIHVQQRQHKIQQEHAGHLAR